MAESKLIVEELSYELGSSAPYSVAVDDDALWVSLAATGELARLGRDGSEERYPVGDQPAAVGVTDDGAWCAVTKADALVRVDPRGGVHVVSAPPGSGPYGLSTSMGVWTTLIGSNQLGHVTADGDLLAIDLPVEGAFPAMLAGGRDGSQWVALNQSGALARRSVSGAIGVMELPEGSAPVGVAVGVDGVWSADIAGDRILRVRDDGTLDEFPLERGAKPHAVVIDRAGGCWFTEWGANRLGRIDENGRIAHYDLDGLGREPHGVARDRHGVLWVALESGRVVGVRP